MHRAVQKSWPSAHRVMKTFHYPLVNHADFGQIQESQQGLSALDELVGRRSADCSFQVPRSQLHQQGNQFQHHVC